MSPLVDLTLSTPAPPTEAASVDGALHARLHESGVILWTTLDEDSWLLRLERADGTVVRGSDPAYAPGGIAVGFDHEAPLGVAVSWYAVILSGDRAGERVGPVTLTQAFPDSRTKVGNWHAVWLKSCEDSSLSRLVWLEVAADRSAPRHQGSLQVIGRQNTVLIDGGVGGEQGSSWSIITETMAEVTALRDLLTSGTLLLQFPPIFDRRDIYLAPTGDLTWQLASEAAIPDWSHSITGEDVIGDLHTWPFEWVEQDRPATADTTVGIPGHTYDDSTRAMPTYDDRAGTYLDRVLG